MTSEEKNQENAFKVANLLRGSVDAESFSFMTSEMAYFMMKLGNATIADESGFYDFINRLDCSLGLRESLMRDLKPVWRAVVNYRGMLTAEECAGVIAVCTNRSEVDNYSVPASLVPLVEKVLSNEPGGRMADLACGRGTLMARALAEDEDLSADGVDLNGRAALFAEMAVSPYAGRGAVSEGDAFGWVINRFARYDKVFCYPPFGLRTERGAQSEAFRTLYPSVFPKIGVGTQSELMFTLAALYVMKDTGRAVIILPEGALFSQTSGALAARQFILDQGYLDTVISLPDHMLERTGINVSILVLAKGEKRESVRMIDATGLGVKGRRFNTLDPEGVEKIVSAAYGFADTNGWGAEHHKRVSLGEIRACDYNFSARYYFTRDNMPQIADGVKFRDVVRDIARGASVGSRDLDDLVAHQDGVCYYLSPGNILGGRIADDLTGMREMPKGAVACAEGDLLLLRTGAPNKVAVFENAFDKPVVPSSNLFICRPDTTKVNPWFLKAFLESADGERTLSSVSVGTAIKSISRKALEEITIPCPPLARQNAIAEAYRAKLAEIASAERQLSALRLQLATIYDSSKEAK